MRRRAVLAAGLGTLAAGCGSADPPAPDRAGPRPLSADEAQALALMRLVNYRRGRTAFTATIPVDDGDLVLAGRLDWVRGLGYAELRAAPNGTPRHLVRWTTRRIEFLPTRGAGLPDRPPAAGWTGRGYEPSAMPLDATVVLLHNLAADRPENPQLLRQSDARWLGTQRVDGAAVTLFAGPSAAATARPGSGGSGDEPRGHTRYWVGADGRLRRFSAQVPGATGWITVDFPQAPAPPVPG